MKTASAEIAGAQREYRTVKEAAKKLPMTEAWLRKMILNKKITYLKIGGRVFFTDSMIEELLEKAVVQPEG